MDKYNAKQYMQRAYRIDRRIEQLKEQCAMARALARKATSTLSATRTSGTASRSKVEEGAIMAVMLEDELECQELELIRAKVEVILVIRAIEDPRQNMLLTYRYMQYKTFDEIAELMHYSDRQVKRIHGIALAEVQKILNNKQEGK